MSKGETNKQEPVIPHDWANWHRHYETSPPLQARLRVVCTQITRALDELPPGPLRVASVCAGDGRDLLSVLEKHPRRADVLARLVDTEEGARQRARALAARAGLSSQLEFLCGDAGLAASYDGIAPVDLLLVSGVLGHLRHDDAARFIANLPRLCREGGCVIWNRHLVRNDGQTQMPLVRRQLRAAGFEEVDFQVASPGEFAVGRARFLGPAQPPVPGLRLFEFVGVNLLDRQVRPRKKTVWQKLLKLFRRKPGAKG